MEENNIQETKVEQQNKTNEINVNSYENTQNNNVNYGGNNYYYNNNVYTNNYNKNCLFISTLGLLLSIFWGIGIIPCAISLIMSVSSKTQKSTTRKWAISLSILGIILSIIFLTSYILCSMLIKEPRVYIYSLQ